MHMVNSISEAQRRLYEKLNHDLGTDIIGYLEDKDVNEIMLNPDGKLWIDKSSKGQICVGSLSKTQAYSIMNSIAGIHGFVVSQHNPRLEADLPVYLSMRGERFTGQVPPIVPLPSFTLRKRSEIVFTLEDYINTGRMTQAQASLLRDLIAERKN